MNIFPPEKGNPPPDRREQPRGSGLLDLLFSAGRGPVNLFESLGVFRGLKPPNGHKLPNGRTLPDGRSLPVVIVSGLPRSGTSLMMEMLRVGGYDLLTDQVRQGDEFNPNGYFEFEQVKRLKDGDHAWMKQAPGRAVKVVSPLLQYLPAGYAYQVIFMQRDLSEVLASQKRMLNGFHKNSSPEEDRLLAQAYSDHLMQVRDWMARQEHVQVFYSSYNQLMASPHTAIEPVMNFLGRSLDVERMQRVIDPQLYRNRAAAPGGTNGAGRSPLAAP